MFFLQLKGGGGQQWVQSSYLLHANVTMAYQENPVYFNIKITYNFAVRKFFEENLFEVLNYFEILLSTKLIKPNDLLTILNQVNPNLQFIMERSTTNLPFLYIMINKTGTKI